MSFFKNPFIIHHRVAAIKMRDFIISPEISEYEHDFIEKIDIKNYRYLAERTYLLASYTRYLLHLRGEAKNNDDVRAASGFLERLLDEYFASRPGVDGNVSTHHWQLAREEYLKREVLSLSRTFLNRISDGLNNEREIAILPQCLELIASHITRSSKSVLESTAHL